MFNNMFPITMKEQKSLQANLELLISLKHSVNTNIGPHLFLYFANLFQSTCLRLSYLTLNNTIDNHTIFLATFEYLIHIIIGLIIIYLVNHFQSERPSQVDILKTAKISSNNSVMLDRIIEIYCKLNYSSCYMFDIDQQFLLSYFNALITFTVMLATIVVDFLK